MTEQRTIASTEDPVCGMTVDPAQACEKGLTFTHDGTEYAFCGKGCLFEPGTAIRLTNRWPMLPLDPSRIHLAYMRCSTFAPGHPPTMWT